MLHWFKFDNIFSYSILDMGEDTTINRLLMGSFNEAENVKTKDINIENIVYLRRVASIYGANASGKSSFFKAFDSMYCNIMGNRDLQGECFIFDSRLKGNSENPIFCELCFSLPDALSATEDKPKYSLYRYGYTLESDKKTGKASKVISEWLKKRPISSFSGQSNYGWNNVAFESKWEVFRRKDGEVEFFNEGEKLNDKIKERVKQPNGKELVLTLLRDMSANEESFPCIFDWLNKIRFVQSELFTDTKNEQQLLTKLAKRVRCDENFKNILKSYLNELDKTIVGFFVEKDDEGKEILKILHRAYEDGKIIESPLSIFKESSGTRRMAGMYQYFRDVIDNGGLLLIDELDIKFHPVAMSYLVGSFRKESNQTAQLVFSTHNLILLEEEYIISRDNKSEKSNISYGNVRVEENYFAQKYPDKFGKSKFNQLTKEVLEKILNDINKKQHIASGDERELNLANLYLSGYFGAIPIENLQI